MRAPKYLIYASLLGLMACGGAVTTPATTPAAKTPEHARAHQPHEGAHDAAQPRRSKSASDLDGVLFVKQTPSDQRVPVQPADIDIDSLPRFDVPEPLAYQTAPTVLPASVATAPLRTEKIDPGYGYGGYGNAVYIVLDAKLGRLQIGNVSNDTSAGDRVYRTCGDTYYQQALLTPARWETLAMDAEGMPEYRVVDAWFDAKSCETSVVKETVVHPKPMLGGLVYGFQSKCADCQNKHTVTFLAPALMQLAANGVGGAASVSFGSFSIIRLPVRKGGAASFTGMMHSGTLATWLSPMPKGPLYGATNSPVSQQGLPPPIADAHVGIEIQQTVSDPHPTAIAYATFMQH